MSTLIFDFDGTIADTFYVAVGVFRKLARTRHITSDTEIERLRGLSARHALASLGARWWHYPYIAYQGRKAVYAERDNVKTIKGMDAVVRTLHAQGHKLFIISSNSTTNIDHFLRNNKLQDYFEGFHGGSGLFNKARAITRFVQVSGIDMRDCWYIGDEVRDVDAARRANMHYVSVSWGYNNRKALEAADATAIVDTPKQLLQLFARQTKKQQ